MAYARIGNLARYMIGLGEYRTVRTAKGGDMFCYPEFIADQMETLFARLRGPVFDVRVERNVFVRAAADFLRSSMLSIPSAKAMAVPS